MAAINNTAAPHAAGYILQLERALSHLAHAGADSAVAVEHLDDVVVLKNGKPILLEQDKSTANAGAKLLADRSKSVWRTLEIWLQHRADHREAACERYLFFVNRPVDTQIATLLKRRAAGQTTSAAVLAALKLTGSAPRPRAKSKAGSKADPREVAKPKPKSKAQALIDRVLAYTDDDLLALLERIEVIEAGSEAVDRASMANGLGLGPRVNADNILDNLLGWLTRRMRTEWANGRVGVITRLEVLAQKDALQDRQARSRLLPRAASDIVVTATDREGALSRTFVEHLGRIEAENDDVVSAVDHFLKFSVEKHRLVKEGEVADREWRDRGDRLTERWRGLMRRRRRELRSSTAQEVGQLLLADATYEHREALDGNACDELYMTSGHYHRLADENDVWWDPNFKPEPSRED